MEHDLRTYPEALLALLDEAAPELRDAITVERRRRAAQDAFWNSAQAIRAALRRAIEERWARGYSANEEARGVDELESEGWELARQRARQLARRSLRRLTDRHRRRPRRAPAAADRTEEGPCCSSATP